MARGKPITTIDADQACRLIAEGKTLSEVATIVGLSYTGLHRALTETWPDEYAEAKQRRDDVIRNRVWGMGVDAAITRGEDGKQTTEIVDAATQRWALDHLIKWHLPEARETQRLEIAGRVTLEHERRLTLGDLIAGRVNRLDEGARGELPAARELLPAPDDNQHPAS